MTRACFLPALFGCLQAVAQISPEKLMATQERSRWLKAEQSIRKALAKDTTNPEPTYLLSLYFFNARHPSFNLDSSNDYQRRAAKRFARSAVRDREHLKKIPLDSQHLIRLRKSIDSTAFEETKRLNSVGAYQHFITHFGSVAQRGAAIELRDEVAFLEALKVNTWLRFQIFIQEYPSSHRRIEAQRRLDKLLYDDKTKDKRLKSYMQFYEQYPLSPYRKQAEKNIFEIATASGSPQSFQLFIEHYPESKWSKMARNMLYEHRSAESDDVPEGGWMTDSLRQAGKSNSTYWVPVIKSGLFGFMDEHGNEVVTPRFETIPDDYRCGDIRERFIVTSQGLLARNGSIFWRGHVSEVKDLGLGYFLIVTDSGRQVIHESGFRVGPPVIEEAQVIANCFVGIQKNKKWSLYSLVGRPMLAHVYDDVTVMDSIILLTRNDKKVVTTPSRIGRAADRGELEENFVIDESRKWGEQYYWVRNGILEGVIDRNLSFVIPLDRQKLRKTSFGFVTGKGDNYFIKGIKRLENTSYVSVIEQAGWVRMKTAAGRHILHDRGFGWLEEGDSAWFQGQLAFLRAGDSVRAFLPAGQKISFQKNASFQFKEYRDSAAWIVLEEKKKKVVYDATSGAKLFMFELGQIEPVSANLFMATYLNKKGIINEDGKILVPLEYDAIVSSDNHAFSLLKDKKFGWYDANSNLLIKPFFDRNILSYNARIRLAYKEHGYGFILPDGKPVGVNEWEEIQYWSDSVAWVKKNFQWKLLEIYSQKVKLDRIRSFSFINDSKTEKICLVQQDNAYGVISNRRGIIIPLQYSDIVNLGSREIPLYFTERHIEEAGISVVVYYDQRGKIIRKQAMETEEFEKIYCEN